MDIVSYFHRMHNPFRNMPARTIRILYTVGTVLALTICTIRLLDIMVFKVTSNDECAWIPIKGQDGLLIKDVVPGGVTDVAGIKSGDTLLMINGAKVRGVGAQAYIDSVKLGDYATYLLSRNGRQFEARVKILKVFDVLALSLYLVGFGFLIVGYVVVLTKPQGYIQRLFGRYGIYAMLLFGLFRFTPLGYPRWEIILMVCAIVIGRILAPPMFVKFFLNFPVRRKILERKWLIPAIYIFNILITMLLFVNNNRNFLPNSVVLIFGSAPISFFIAGLIIFATSYYYHVPTQRRSQLKPILVSVAIGVATLTYILLLIIINPFAMFLTPVLVLPASLLAVVPIGFGYAIFRYRLMDIDLVVKRSLIYGTVTASLALIYLVTVVGIGNMFSYFFGTEDNKAFSVVAFVIIAFVFDPIKRKAQDSIDRTFYRERRNYQKALLEFSQELPRQMNLDQILTSMVNRISNTMHVEQVAVVLCDPTEGCYSKSKNISEACCTFDETSHSLLQLLKTTKTAQSFALIEEEPEHFSLNDIDKKKIIDAGIILSVPMFLQDRMIGVINVGPKMSDKVYSQEDVDLLMTVGSQAAIAIENARLHVSEIEKQKIEEELKLASKIQQGLLPKSNPVMPGLDITGTNIPAKTVGGDYFDFIQLDPKRMLVIVADVSGKGISAALYMSKVQGMVQLAAQMYSSPKDILIHVNRMLYDGMERKYFITMIIALFDLQRSEVTICRAGHNKALIGSNGNLAFLNGSGIGLGLERGPIFDSELEEVRRPLIANEIYFFYTDGLTEAMDTNNNQLGEDTVRTLVQHNTQMSSVKLQQSVIEAMKTFQGTAEQHDDVTLVVVKTY
jgi:sigma-B regulation protein RsbU (phosphoserine phosphatase)